VIGVLTLVQRCHLLFRAGIACSIALIVSCSGPAPSVDQGKLLYQANGCASCHGASGRGDGSLATMLGSRPANLRDPTRFKRGTSEVDIARTLAEGIIDAQVSTPQLHHNHHDLAMPKFDHLSEVERRSIALYIISMQENRNYKRKDDHGESN
jgi:mono/diheme cytochrome c family protein